MDSSKSLRIVEISSQERLVIYTSDETTDVAVVRERRLIDTDPWEAESLQKIPRVLLSNFEEILSASGPSSLQYTRVEKARHTNELHSVNIPIRRLHNTKDVGVSVRRQLCWFEYGLKPISGDAISNTMLVSGLERFWECDRIAEQGHTPNTSRDYSSGLDNTGHSDTNIRDDRDIIYISSDDEPQNIQSAPKKEVRGQWLQKLKRKGVKRVLKFEIETSTPRKLPQTVEGMLNFLDLSPIPFYKKG